MLTEVLYRFYSRYSCWRWLYSFSTYPIVFIVKLLAAGSTTNCDVTLMGLELCSDTSFIPSERSPCQSRFTILDACIMSWPNEKCVVAFLFFFDFLFNAVQTTTAQRFTMYMNWMNMNQFNKKSGSMVAPKTISLFLSYYGAHMGG